MAWIIDPATGKLVNDTEFEPVQEGMPDPKSGLLRRTVGDTVTSAAKGLLVGVPQAAVGLARVATLGAADQGGRR